MTKKTEWADAIESAPKDAKCDDVFRSVCGDDDNGKLHEFRMQWFDMRVNKKQPVVQPKDDSETVTKPKK